MNPYDWNDEWNKQARNPAEPESESVPEAPAEAAAPQAPAAPTAFEGSAFPAGPEGFPDYHATEQTAVPGEPDACTEPRMDPEPPGEAAPASAYTAPQFRPAYSGYDYSGPAYTARPDQSSRPAYQSQPAPQPVKAEKKRSGGFWKKAVALALVCVLLGGGAGFGGALLANKLQAKQSPASSARGTAVQVAAPRETTELNLVTVDSGKLMTASQVYKANVNSTVGITTEITTNWWGYQSTSAAAGSGFILTEDGYILTNEHVIEDANSITVAMYDGTTYPATVVGYDANNDIAVLKIDATGLTPVTLGNSDAIEVGDEVVAIGNPLGELTFSMSEGIVSSVNRAINVDGTPFNMIQVSAAINPGNSGGALFNMYGEVIGITNAKYSSSSYSSAASIDNIGFAIPINSVRGIVSSIIEKGYVSTPYIGVTVGNVSQESQDYGLPKGAAIRSVEKGSPAEQAGLQANDIVTAVNGETISSYEELGKIISASEVGDALELTVYRLSEDREGKSVTLTVTVGERIQDAIPNSSSQGSSGYSGGQPGGFPGYPSNP